MLVTSHVVKNIGAAKITHKESFNNNDCSIAI